MIILQESETSYNLNVPFMANVMSRLQATVYKALSGIVHFARPGHFARLKWDMSRAFCTSRLQALIYKALENYVSRHVPLMSRQTLKRDMASPYL